MSEIDEIRKRWKGITSKSLIIDPPKDAWTTILLSCYVADDIHALEAAVDTLTAERAAAESDAREWLRENEAELRWCLKNAIAERDALKARVEELEALVSYAGTCRECVHWYRPTNAEGVCYRGYCLTQREGDESCAFGKYKEAKPND